MRCTSIVGESDGPTFRWRAVLVDDDGTTVTVEQVTTAPLPPLILGADYAMRLTVAEPARLTAADIIPVEPVDGDR